MHIHGTNSQMMALIPTQASQQASEARKAAAEVRRKLSGFAASEDSDDAVSRAEAYSDGNRGKKQQQSQDEEERFRGVFFSVNT